MERATIFDGACGPEPRDVDLDARGDWEDGVADRDDHAWDADAERGDSWGWR